MRHLARALRCSEGHAYTVVIVGALLSTMVALGIPPLLDEDDTLVPASATTATTASIPRFGEGSATTVASIPRFGESPTTTTTTSASDAAATPDSAQ